VDAASDGELQRTLAFCDEQGATSINEIVQFDMLDDLIASLHLKPIPSKKLRARLQPTQSLATALSPGQEAASPADGAGGWLADAGESIKGMLQRLDTSTRLLLKTENAMEADGFAVRPLLRKQADDARVLASLEALLIPKNPEYLGKGKDIQARYGSYDRLRLAAAWKIEHPRNQSRYETGRANVAHDLEILERKGRSRAASAARATVATAAATADDTFGLQSDANEALLLHGSPVGTLLSVLATGINERFSGSNAGTAFGDGIYLAEDIGKTDQYSDADSAYDKDSELHRRLYGRSVRHPGDVFYVLVCRASLGCPITTAQTGRDARDADDANAKVFPVGFRELAGVAGVSPPIFHHSLFATAFPRYREIVIFHSEYVLADYLVAYQRFDGDQQLNTSS